MLHYVDILCFVFRRTNNLFRYFSIGKRKTLWGHKYYYCYRGRGSSAVPWRANTGEGWKGKMKLRLVKFLTSRENEIENKEEGGRSRTTITLSAIAQLGRSHSPAPAPLPPSFHTIPFSLPPPVPPARILRRPAPPPPRAGRAIFSSCHL